MLQAFHPLEPAIPFVLTQGQNLTPETLCSSRRFQKGSVLKVR